jgi:hypothetical protein
MSASGSPLSTPSPSQRHASLSPSHAQMSYGLYQGNSNLPPHLRNDFQRGASRTPPPISPSLPSLMTGHRHPSNTSHPQGFHLPPLEPNIDNRSASGSPHLSARDWQSPVRSLGSPGPQESMYGEPVPSGYSLPASGHPMYHQNSYLRRPNSAEPHVEPYQPHMMPTYQTKVYGHG